MRRLALAFLFVLGLSWGLAPHSPAAPGPGSGPGLGSERAYLDAAGTGPLLAAQALPAIGPLRQRAWRRPTSERLRAAAPERPVRRRFLQWMRLQLEGG